MRVLAHHLTLEQRVLLAHEKLNGLAWILGPHVLERIISKGLTQDSVLHALHFGSLVEYNDEERGERRTLWKGRGGTLVLVDMGSRRIITAYWNPPGDTHRTVDRSLFYWGEVTDGDLKLDPPSTRGDITPRSGCGSIGTTCTA